MQELMCLQSTYIWMGLKGHARLQMLYLLRVDVSATTFEHARTSVADAIAFDDQLTMLSLERSLSKGVLFQSLLEVGLRLTSRADHRIEHFVRAITVEQPA